MVKKAKNKGEKRPDAVTYKEKQQENTRSIKRCLIAAMEKTGCNVTWSCRVAGCKRETYYRYYEGDKRFRDKIDKLNNIMVDYAEEKLLGLINAGNPQAIMFTLKCKGKDRGWIDKTDIVINNGEVEKQVYIMPNGTKIEF